MKTLHHIGIIDFRPKSDCAIDIEARIAGTDLEGFSIKKILKEKAKNVQTIEPDTKKRKRTTFENQSEPRVLNTPTRLNDLEAYLKNKNNDQQPKVPKFKED